MTQANETLQKVLPSGLHAAVVCRWGRTLKMNAALCHHVGSGAFPTPEQIAAFGAARLQASCGLGYRARSLHRLAEQVGMRTCG